LINIGDFLEMLTTGSWPATHHRVVVPKEEWRKSTCRQSIVMFVDPDPEVVFKPLALPHDKYPPVYAGEYLTRRRNQTYK
jgi:isopenicillin N synthase-like dioxygenase